MNLILLLVAGLGVMGLGVDASAQDRRVAPGQVFRDCPECPAMVVIPAGRFVMGSSAEEPGRFNFEGPEREVAIRSFALGKTEVTFAEFDVCTAENACRKAADAGWGRGNRPVIDVNRNDAAAYAAWLSKKTGKTYRLPSEAEWEYAARAGTKSRYSCGNDEACLNSVAWHGANAGGRTQPVGGKTPNAFGLHDMHGNVWEWVEDCDNANYIGAPTDGSAWLKKDCLLRVRRGGSWVSEPKWLRSAVRGRGMSRDESTGFRIARD
ncbi:MAG: formylglycine-generating enzyme family protein [Alphaproteobacteria bacterium]|nr:formylglycine-generating enzyme family protein [Alphaproteobacteria bacterium]